MRLVWCLLALAAACPVVHGDDKKDIIRLPIIKGAEPVLPVDGIINLSPEVWYVVESDVECLTFLSPGGAVSVTKEAGPIRIRGKFAEGTGKVETKTFKGPFLYLFEAISDGKDEAIIVPVGAKSEKDAKRVTFQVGKMPQPPPIPQPGPGPKPVPAGKLWGFVMIEQSGDAWAGRGEMVVKSIEYTKQAGLKYRIADADVVDKDGKPPEELAEYIKQAKAGKMPMAFIITENGESVWSGDCPRTSADMIALLKKYGGK